MKTKKLKYWIIINQWMPNTKESMLSQQIAPGRWALFREIRFNTLGEVEDWLATIRAEDGLTRSEYYAKARATDDNYLYSLKQVSK